MQRRPTACSASLRRLLCNSASHVAVAMELVWGSGRRTPRRQPARPLPGEPGSLEQERGWLGGGWLRVAHGSGGLASEAGQRPGPGWPRPLWRFAGRTPWRQPGLPARAAGLPGGSEEVGGGDGCWLRMAGGGPRMRLLAGPGRTDLVAVSLHRVLRRMPRPCICMLGGPLAVVNSLIACNLATRGNYHYDSTQCPVTRGYPVSIAVHYVANRGHPLPGHLRPSC